MIGDPITKSGDPHVMSGHVSELDRSIGRDCYPQPGVKEEEARAVEFLNTFMNRDIAKPYETTVVDEETGGRKGQKAARFSYIPQDVLWELAEHYTKGLEKYPDDEEGRPNWQRGYDWRLSVDAMMRHFSSWLQGEDVDPETGSNHLIAAIWHLFALRWFQMNGKGKDFR